MTKTYNGHKNYNYWNVALWFGNDYGLYQMVTETVRRNKRKDDAAREIQNTLRECGLVKTPDGAPYTYNAIRAAISGWE